MSALRLLAAALALAATACVSPVNVPPGPSYYVMRHLDTDPAVTNPPLTPKGAASAEALVEWFDADPPAVIYVSATTRAQQTAAPLATRLALTPKVYDPADTPALVRMVRAESGTVLIVGHSNTVPDIVAGLGGTRPADISHDRFGDIWHVAGAQGYTTRLSLSGD